MKYFCNVTRSYYPTISTTGNQLETTAEFLPLQNRALEARNPNLWARSQMPCRTFHGLSDQTAGSSESFTNGTIGITLTEWTILVQRPT